MQAVEHWPDLYALIVQLWMKNIEMNKTTTLHFFCGKMAAGKSTLARTLAEKNGGVLLREDHWLAQLYPEEITDIPGYLKYSSRLKNVFSSHIQALLAQGVSVILDFPGNTKEQRNWFRTIYTQANVAHALHFIDVSDAVCKHQLKERSKDKPNGAAFTSEQEFDAITKYYQAPSESEGFNIIKYARNNI